MATSAVHCPHCKALGSFTVGEIERCPSCGGEVRVHEVGKDEQDEALKRLLSSVKIVERVGAAPGSPAGTAPSSPKKRPWWKFWA
jgi:hypothetical protein